MLVVGELVRPHFTGHLFYICSNILQQSTHQVRETKNTKNRSKIFYPSSNAFKHIKNPDKNKKRIASKRERRGNGGGNSAIICRWNGRKSDLQQSTYFFKTPALNISKRWKLKHRHISVHESSTNKMTILCRQLESGSNIQKLIRLNERVVLWITVNYFYIPLLWWNTHYVESHQPEMPWGIKLTTRHQ